MRALKRSIARHMMELAEIEQINKKKYEQKIVMTGNARKDIARAAKKKSYFALKWKAYMDPDSDERKALHNKLRREAMIEKARNPDKKPGYWPYLGPWPIKVVKGGIK